LFSRWDLAHVAVIGAAGAVEIDECSEAAFVFPGCDLDLSPIFDEKAPFDGDLLRLLPVAVRVDSIIVVVSHGLSLLLRWFKSSMFKVQRRPGCITLNFGFRQGNLVEN